MVLYRSHRGSFSESLKTVREVTSVANILSAENWIGVPDDVLVEEYGYDDRINWNTHIVTLKTGGVLGFTNGPVS